MNSVTTDKLRECFGEVVVYKDLQHTSFFSTLGLPAFTRDWLLKRSQDKEGRFEVEKVKDFVERCIPKKSDWERIKGRVIKDYERVRMLARISMHIDVASGDAAFTLPDFGVSSKETIIDDEIWHRYKEKLTQGHEVWGLIELGYRPPDNSVSPKLKGKIKLTDYEDFCPYTVDVEYLKEARDRFSTEEWMNVVLSAVDYNSDGYRDEEEKLAMLSRLLPFVEKNLNMIELAPKGTGKSYLFGNVSRFAWLSSGGNMSRAKMFYDMQRRTEGLVSAYDVVTLDEVKTISFPDVAEMQGALKGYLENGNYTVGNHHGTGSAGVVLCGNISYDLMHSSNTNKFRELPQVFQESALVERFNGFIEGWQIPHMREDLKIAGWGLNSEYYCAILHELRDDMSYSAIVDDLVIVPEGANTRDTKRVKQLATAWMKLLFPNVRSAGDISTKDFKKYCLYPAMRMRSSILDQLRILDEEYRNRSIPPFKVKRFTATSPGI